MSRAFKIALLLKCRSSLPIYRDMSAMSEVELDQQLQGLMRRMRTNESRTIAKQRLLRPLFCWN